MTFSIEGRVFDVNFFQTHVRLGFKTEMSGKGAHMKCLCCQCLDHSGSRGVNMLMVASKTPHYS